MKIYTRGGDQGDTSLFGGARVRKSELRIHAYGEVDELNSMIGWCAAAAQKEIASLLNRESARLFQLGSHLATPPNAAQAAKHLPEWSSQTDADLEKEIDQWVQELPELTSFILPGGGEIAARLHLARTVCRRVERIVVQLAQEPGQVNAAHLSYLNRLSDWLFTLARVANCRAAIPEQAWDPQEPL